MFQVKQYLLFKCNNHKGNYVFGIGRELEVTLLAKIMKEDASESVT